MFEMEGEKGGEEGLWDVWERCCGIEEGLG